MKVTRKLPKLDLVPDAPQRYRPGQTVDLRNIKTPMKWCLEFLRTWEALSEESINIRRRFIAKKYQEVFGQDAECTLSLEILKARIAYRLQYEGHRVTETQPSERFLRNYKAMMRFEQGENAVDGMDPETRHLAKLCLSEEKYTMAAKKKTAAVKKGAAKGSTEKKGPRKGGVTILNAYSLTHFSRCIGDMGAKPAQALAVLEKLGHKNVMTASVTTAISDQTRPGSTRRKDVKLTAEDKAKVSALLKTVQEAEKTAKATAAAKKPAAVKKAAVKKNEPKAETL